MRAPVGWLCLTVEDLFFFCIIFDLMYLPCSIVVLFWWRLLLCNLVYDAYCALVCISNVVIMFMSLGILHDVDVMLIWLCFTLTYWSMIRGSGLLHV